MYLHLGQDTVIRESNIVGIFDLDNTTVSAHTRNFLGKAEKDGKVVNVTQDLPKTFVVCSSKNANKDQRVYICQLSTSTLRKRSGSKD